MRENIYWLGIDIGSTTVKTVLVNPDNKEIVYKKYTRHRADQRMKVAELLREASVMFPGISVVPVFCGSGSKNLSEELNAPYIQEVVANSLAVREFYPETKVSIELGGQDAKVSFFHRDEKTGKVAASDMRMNGSCAGGTGAFLDEVAVLLKLPVEELNKYATEGKTVYDISGRCGVFAKTDIQPLLNQGIRKEDLVLSCFHAVAKQTIGGLAQGLEIHPPVIFEGGPLFFNPVLVRVFSERLNLKKDEVIYPENPQIMIAFGAALGVPVMFSETAPVLLDDFSKATAFLHKDVSEESSTSGPLFNSSLEKEEFLERHCLPEFPCFENFRGQKLEVYLGIDSGSTTSKFVLLDRDENPVYRFYSKNHGEPLKVIKKALLEMKQKADSLDIELKILGAGTTGYGELLFNKAFRADYHTVETVSHAEAALKYCPDASFILDIGGQDMKAVFMNNGIVTGITLNEACSAGCGSFLENFADSLSIPVEEIAEKAFKSKAPSVLGSRCTVFMNSSVITEQKNGKDRNDIVAGLCNSVIENVFTKVIRLSNLKLLGEKIVVQGGTFKNNAVLRSMEQFAGREVIRSPYPGEMGAIGIALLTKKKMEEEGQKTAFPGWEELGDFSYTQKTGLICPHCSNSCSRTLLSFSSGETFITGNRCERGEILGETGDPEVREKLRKLNEKREGGRDLFTLRRRILFKDRNPAVLSPPKDVTIGLPRVLDFWESFPFWSHFFRSMGFRVELSGSSSMKMYEHGLSQIPSDTICFPSKLAHGHILDLIDKNVDRIFMPIMNRMIPEHEGTASHHACAVLKGYPMVLRACDNPLEKFGIPMDTPVFHWTDKKAKSKSLVEYIGQTFGLPEKITLQAIQEGDRAMDSFRNELVKAGEELLASLKDDEFAVVIAGRPYHSDRLINHSISDYFNRLGIAVLPLDALPGIHKADLGPVRAELTVNYHVRMFSAAQIASAHPKLEFVQIVSFGCGHDAVISDEVSRIMMESSGKSPLILKMDESDVSGPLNIRIKSFVETVKAQRKKGLQFYKPCGKPYEVVYSKEEKKKEKTILVPNVSWAFAQTATAAIKSVGYRVEAMPLAGDRAKHLGKKYVHNDMCFPAQINIGEFLACLDEGLYNPDDVVLALAKAQCDCRLAHYAMMARQALDDAGYPQIAIVTTDEDTKNMHPAFKLGPFFEIRMCWGLIMNDVLEDLRRKIRPYEINKGETDRIFEESVSAICRGFDISLKNAQDEFEKAVQSFIEIEYDRSIRKPRVFMIGEFLLNFHPSSNNNIERYLEKNGMEVIMPNLFYNLHREFMLEIDQKEEYHVSHPAVKIFLTKLTDKYINHIINKIEKIGARHPLWEEKTPLKQIAQQSQHIIDKTFTAGEGWMIAGEILHHADHGVNSFLILQPFGCLPNHVTGRGLVKAIKREKPNIQILALDYDPDTSFANIENRLQMLIINTKEMARISVSEIL